LTQAQQKQQGISRSQRLDLVSLLIEKEPSLTDQIKLYLDMKEYNKALRKAFSGG